MGRDLVGKLEPNDIIVSIHAPTWGATAGSDVYLNDRTKFQSTRPRGARLIVKNENYHLNVSIHAPTWGATPHSCFKYRPFFVSIHAPTWGATVFFQHRSYSQYVSIHAPTWGATNFFLTICISKEFQSTRPRGARHTRRATFPSTVNVSIHAPTWGATFPRPQIWRFRGFNPRAHVGRDRYSSPYSAPVLSFQSTRPRGARLRKLH